MRVAGAVILGVLGAILAFAVTVETEGFSINTIGLIMLAGAAVWFVVELVNGATGNRTKSVETVQHDDGSVSQRTQTTEHRDDA